MEERRVVRMTLLRGTLHSVTARDALALRSLIQPAIEKVAFGSSPLRSLVRAGVNLDEAVELLRRLLQDSPKTRAELVKAIAERWPGVDADSLGYAMYVIPTVQVTPRGLWRRSGGSRFTTIDAWLGRSIDERGDVDVLIRRYLTAFGPATVADAQYWSGLTELGVAFEQMRPSLRTFVDENGRELFDVPSARRPNADTPAPVRFLPEYDNVVIGHKNRSRIVGGRMGHRPRRRVHLGAMDPRAGTRCGDASDRAVPPAHAQRTRRGRGRGRPARRVPHGRRRVP